MFDFPTLKSKKYEAHLMINNPLIWAKKNYMKVDILIAHVESFKNKKEIISFLNFVKLKKKIVGLILLVKGSIYTVKYSSSLAKRFGVSEFVIGLTLVAIGTSLPELVSSIVASLKNAPAIIIGNIVGANIANITLVVGLAAIMSRLVIKKEIIMRDSYMLLTCVLLFILVIIDKKISFIEGVFFILFYFVYLVFIFQSKKTLKGKYGFKEFIPYFFNLEYLITFKNFFTKHIKYKSSSNKNRKIKHFLYWLIIKDILIIILSLSAVIYGANLMIERAIYFAELYSFPKFLIGILISLGTTAPEMTVSISAARKGFGNLAIGNAIGSVIVNTLFILGCASLISPIKIAEGNFLFVILALVFFSLTFFAIINVKKEISKFDGIILIILYLIFLIWTLIRQAI